MRYLILLAVLVGCGGNPPKTEEPAPQVEVAPKNTPFIWEVEQRPYRIEVDGKYSNGQTGALGIEHRYAVVHWNDMKYDIDKDAIWAAAEEIYNEFARDIEEKCPDGDAKRISIRFPYFDKATGSQKGNVLRVATKMSAPTIPDWPPPEVDWVSGWDWRYDWLYDWNEAGDKRHPRPGVDPKLFDQPSVFGEELKK